MLSHKSVFQGKQKEVASCVKYRAEIEPSISFWYGSIQVINYKTEYLSSEDSSRIKLIYTTIIFTINNYYKTINNYYKTTKQFMCLQRMVHWYSLFLYTSNNWQNLRNTQAIWKHNCRQLLETLDLLRSTILCYLFPK